MTSALVIGYGSIGQRHARLLAELGCSVQLLTQQDVGGFPVFRSLDEALDSGAVDYVVIANETVRHADTLQALAEASFAGAVLVEKPLAAAPFTAPAGFARLAVAYNLRFHPVLVALGERLAADPPVSIHVSCGQDLDGWRPGRAVADTYSAHADRGGGVLRDLSHELDYLLWLAGPWSDVAALGGNYGIKGIAADEAWSVLSRHDNCPAAGVRINYLDQPARRQITVNTRSTTLVADMIAGTLTVNGETQTFTVDRDATYIAMHQAILAGDMSRLCSAGEASAVLDFIAAIETAAGESRWVKP